MASTRRDVFKKFLQNNIEKIAGIGAKIMKKSVEEKDRNPEVSKALEYAVDGLRISVNILNKILEKVRGY